MYNVKHLRQCDYICRPWKNGKGETRDALMLPNGSDHSNFDVRVAFSPIKTEGVFSKFEGVSRVLTLIEGDNLTLNFDDGRVVLKTQDSHAFNCELPVVGTPSDADVLVINVMAKATKWEISSCAVATEFNKQLLPNEMAILIPLTDGCVFNGDVEMFAPGKHETLVVSGTCHLSCKSLNTKFLKAVLKNKSEK